MEIPCGIWEVKTTEFGGKIFAILLTFCIKIQSFTKIGGEIRAFMLTLVVCVMSNFLF